MTPVLRKCFFSLSQFLRPLEIIAHRVLHLDDCFGPSCLLFFCLIVASAYALFVWSACGSHNTSNKK